MKIILSLLLSAWLARMCFAQDRPNILWLVSEDTSHHWFGCYGNDRADTPNIDRLAREGVRYQFAYANAPVCAVARFTIITGRYACSMGAQNMRSRYPIPPRFKPYISHLRDAGYYCVNRSKTDYNFRTNDQSHWDASSNKAHWKNRPEGSPFFAVFNVGTSHESSLFEGKIRKAREQGLIPASPRRDPQQVDLPPYLPDTPEIRQDWVTYMDIVTAMDRQIGDWLRELDEAGLREDTIVMYYGDHGGILPRAKRYVYDTGTHVPLVVRCPKKWAHLGPGRPGSVSTRPVSFIDLPPTVLSLAGVEIPDRLQGRAFLGEAKREAEPYVFLFGQRFDSRMLRFVRGVTDGHYRYLRNFHPHRHRGILAGYPHGQAGWRSYYALLQAKHTNAAQSAFWKKPQPVEELYDTQADPWEVTNLANDPKHADVLAKMREATIAKMKAIRDTGIVPEAMYHRLSRNSTVYDYVHADAFPYDQLLTQALRASQGERSELVQLQAAMRSDHPVMRYWGAVGCTILGKAATSAAGQLEAALKDGEPIVRVAAAEALVAQGDTERGLAAMIETLQETDDDMLALETLNIAAAWGLTKRIPEAIYLRAANTGSYPKRMIEDY